MQGNVCEIAECPGDDPACSDCNDNGVPDACELVPVGYKNTNHSGDFFTTGALVLFADDIRLVPTECNMIAYEFAHKGNGIIQVDFRNFLDNNDPNDGGVIPDTRNVCFSSGSDVQICRASRSTPIPLPQDFFVVFKTINDAAGPIATCQQASVGSTEDSYAFHDGKAWVFEDIGDSCHAGFDIRIECASIPDCNGNSIPDECDLAAMTSEDCNANGIPDECALGDIDGNQAIDILDYAGFNACFTGPCGNQPCDPPLDIGSCCQIVDFDGDGDVDLKDVRGFQRVFAPSPP